MAIYAIGDLQGCYDTLVRLLERLRFDQKLDSLWFCGDLVNRGGQSLETLRFIKGLGESATCVLGNHDLHLLAERVKPPERRQRSAELKAVLDAPDSDELLDWLRFRPVFHFDEKLNFAMVHAGIAPLWTLGTARAQAQVVQKALRADDYGNVLMRMYGDRPRGWTRELKGMNRLRACINAFTRMRFCDVKGNVAFEAKGMPGTQPPGYYPWYEVPGHKPRNFRVVCGHWSTLGKFMGLGVYCLDTGCVWGRSLTALRLDAAEPEFISVNSTLPPREIRGAD
jgi:bis(5'-nucleosyl)-tetraphosphatase (symmetrical)